MPLSDSAPFSPERHESEAQFRELMAHLRQAFWMNNAAGTAVDYMSPAYDTIWGRSREDLYAKRHSLLDSIHHDDQPRMSRVMAINHNREGYEEEYRIVRPDGTIRWIWGRSYPVRDDQGTINRYAGIAEDITDRKSAEKQRARLAAIIDYTDDTIVSVTLDGTIIAWNGGAERKYGYTAEEVIGLSILILVPGGEAENYLAVLKRARQGEFVAPFETTRRRKDGSFIPVSAGLSPIEARDGPAPGISKTGNDISRVRKLEAQLIEAQKMEVIGQLTGGVAHDFNNVLSVILGYSELLVQQLGVEHSGSKALTAIQHAAQRGAGLTRQLLIFSRKETVQFAIIDLNGVLKTMDSMLRQLVDENIELTINPGLNIGRVRADAGYIGQVLMNLVINARDAMPGGGKLTVVTADATLPVEAGPGAADGKAGDFVLLSVSDTGTGIPDAVKARLFEPLFTTKKKGKGTGLGLATCRSIVNKCGGHIVLHTELGVGSTFTIYLPRVTQTIDATAFPFAVRPAPRGSETVLVVEDEPEVRHLTCAVLRTQGYTVLSASNGEEGHRMVRDRKGSEIRLVISDIIMPGMGGQEMANQLKISHPDLRVLFTSGYTDDAIAHHGELDPDIAFLAKPYSIGTLARKVRALLDADLDGATRRSGGL